jgi:hypothetical protein
MSNSRKTAAVLVTWAVLMLLSGYAGAYRSLVDRTLTYHQARICGISYDATYRVGGSGWTTFFAPAHWLDRHLRPDFWAGR